MKHLKSQSLFFIVFVFHQSLSQQSTQQYNQQSPQQYSQQSSQQYNQQPSQQYNQQSSQQYVQQNQNKIQLEDIERDNLKSSQQQSTQQQTQSQQYVPVTQDQHQLLYSIQPQQTNLFSASQQAAVGTPSVYTSQPITTMLISPQQQQQLIQPYFTQTQQSYPYIDFGGFPLYPGLYPFVVPQTSQQTNQISSGVVNEYYKTIQPAASAVKTPSVSSAVKTVPTTQVPAISNYLLSNAIPNTFYQPVSFTQPQNAQQYLSYNYYQSQNPQKSVFSAGIKSTTPSVPVKGKEDQFVPVTNGNYRFEYSAVDQNNYNKVRLSG